MKKSTETDRRTDGQTHIASLCLSPQQTLWVHICRPRRHRIGQDIFFCRSFLNNNVGLVEEVNYLLADKYAANGSVSLQCISTNSFTSEARKKDE